MIRQLFNYLAAWIRGDNAELNIEFRIVFTWLDIAITIALIVLGIYLW
ncbi:hypothetical protein SAMN05444682_1103 [Parapedobacter indicus]|uniref:Uncharacterized protein n=1 Tax=Parapedobacter indicus TaxID=1477437 RepID=A0A1I3RKP2_9SPHI|nr:hypothetical protein CLV26_110242 [Parapedobacter indicus]SFJ45891.1 hypothetical protein SAMN05444682_1103 [Parapedobacter indicus]